MAKEKKLPEINENDYIKEILSFFYIIFSIVILGSLGTLGYYGNLVFKITFGEYYFLIFLILIYSSIKYIVKGRHIDIHLVSFQGFIFIYLAISIISHFTIYENMGLTSSNVFKESINLYKNYFKVYEPNYYVGGGIIGLLLFQVFIFLFGSIGVLTVSISFMILGLSYMLNRSVFDFLRRFKHYFTYISKFKGFMRRSISKFTKVKDDRIPKVKYKPSLALLDDKEPNSNLFLQEEITKEYKEEIKKVINDKNLPVKFENYYIGHTSTSYLFTLLSNKLDSRLDILLKIFNYKAFYMIERNNLLIETKNQFKDLLTLKSLLVESGDLLIPIGVNNLKDIVIFDIDNYNSLLICGDKDSGVKTYVRALITSIILNLQHAFKMKIFDIHKDFKELSGINNMIIYSNSMNEINKMVEDEIYELDKRLEILKYLDTQNYNEANQKIVELNKKIDILYPRFLLINVTIDLFNSEILKKIDYLASFGKKCGIFIILITRGKDNLKLLNLNLYQKLLFKIDDLSISLKLTNTDIACMLDGKGEFIYMENKKISHGQAPYISMTDFLKILNKFTF